MPHALTILAPGSGTLPPSAPAPADSSGSRHLVWICPHAPEPDWLQQAGQSLAQTPEERTQIEQALRQQAWGLLPGWHRLPLLPTRLVLHLAIGDPWQLVREASGHFDHISLSTDLLRQADASQREGLAAGLSALARHGSLLQPDPPCSALPDDWLPQLRSRGWVPADTAGLAPGSMRFAPRWRDATPPAAVAREATVIGAGLAGSAVAYSLAERGWQVTVLDRAATPAAGASGLPVGLVVPHSSADDTLISRVIRAGIRSTLQRAAALLQPGQDWAATGVLEHCVDGKSKLPRSWQANAAHPPDWISASRPWASTATPLQLQQASLPADAVAVWHECAAWIKPWRLVQAQLAHPAIHFVGNTAVHSLQRPAADAPWQLLDDTGQLIRQTDLLVLTAGFESRQLLQSLQQPLPLNPLRGQIAWGWQQTSHLGLPAVPVNGKGSLACHVPWPQSAQAGSIWITGSTFSRSDNTPDVREQEFPEIWQKLQMLHPAAADELQADFAQGRVQGWAGVRATLPDRLPAVGALARSRHGQPADLLQGLQLSCGMGARGLSLSVLAGELLAAQLHDEPWPLEKRLARLLAASRWLDKPV